LGTRVDPTTLPAQPLPKEQVSARELGAYPCFPEVFDRLAEQAVGTVVFAQQGS
jgi:hypothetical protein